ncbi:MAG: signal peptide peptidase SppA [Deltaproteobacteria bacterium]|nr:signal peptide peptidase SppA [Deltaproteobacteria bacterium]
MLLARLARNLVALLFAPLRWLLRAAGRPRGDVLWISIRGAITELPPPARTRLVWLARMLGRLPAPATSLAMLDRLLGHAAKDAALRAIVFAVEPLRGGFATAEAVAERVARARAAGKETIVYLPGGGGNKEMLVAVAADRIFVGPSASVALVGLAAESVYLKGLLDKVDVHVEVEARREYKGAAEPLTQTEMSAPQREQLEALLSGIGGRLVAAVAEGRRLRTSDVEKRMETMPLRAADARSIGLIDAVAYDDQVAGLLGKDGKPARVVSASRYFAWHEASYFTPIVQKPVIAIVPVHGAIVDRVVGFRPPGLPKMVAGSTVVSMLRALRKDPRVIGVVVHVDSRGGSVLASDQIHREVVRLRERKPVVACLGDVAASGGYYVAAPADAILARPTTITGSIGVVAARPILAAALDRLGIRREVVRTHPGADARSVLRDPTESERRVLAREIDGHYDAFKEVVARGRKLSAERVEELARGRVWSGAAAIEHGLVDRAGGLSDAVEEVRRRAGPLGASAEPATASPPRIDVEPPEPLPAEIAAVGVVTDALLGRLAPGAASLLQLALDGADVVAVAADVPEIR